MSYVVPAGFVAVVSHVTAYCSPGGADVVVFLEDDLTGAALWWHDFAPGGAGYGSLESRWVFAEGLGFHFQVDVTIGFTASADVYAGGYLLSAP
jgi:hypothetical protein